jgi:uncharacterized Zn-binding protein involved in type VI secretion
MTLLVARKDVDVCTGHDACPSRKAVEGSPDVFLEGHAVVRLGDKWEAHGCPAHPKHEGRVVQASSEVTVNGLPVVRIGDPLDCGGEVKTGSSDLYAGGGLTLKTEMGKPATPKPPEQKPPAPAPVPKPPAPAPKPSSAGKGKVNTSHPWLQTLGTSHLDSGPDGSCVATTLGNTDRLGIRTFNGGTTADPNNARAAMVQMINEGNWSSVPLDGAQQRTIHSAYGSAQAYVLDADSYERMAQRGEIPSGAILFQTRHGWDSPNGPYGNDMGVVRDGGRVTHNYKSMSPIIYSDAKEVVLLVPSDSLSK